MTFSELLKSKKIKKADFIKESGIGKTTLTYYLNGKRDIDGANKDTIYKMAGVLNITVSELIDSIKEEASGGKKAESTFIIKTPKAKIPSSDLIELSKHMLQPKFNERLIAQYKFDLAHKDRQGIYAYTQKNLSYNSSRIEGNTLTPDETAELFSTGTIDRDGIVYKPKDVEEMSGHFAMFNRCIATLDDPLSIDMIKGYHFSLENGVFEFLANGGVPGEFKRRKNIVGGITTVDPEDVPFAMEDLLKWYNKEEKTVETLAKFHAAYETIHPFQDGNGRTGRMIIFREALLNGIDPFIVEDKNKLTYYKALQEIHNTKDHSLLIEFFKEEQQTFLQNSIPYLLGVDEYSEFLDSEKDEYEK